MLYSTTAAALVAAMTVVQVAARPSLRHRDIHTKRDLGRVNWSKVNYDLSGVDWSKVNYNGDAAPSPGAVPAGAPAPSDAAKSVGEASDKPSDKANDKPSDKPSGDAPDHVGDTIEHAVDNLFGNGKTAAKHTAVGLWNSLKGVSNDRKAFGLSHVLGGQTGDGYSGQVGEPYGSNIILVDDVGDHDHTNTFVNDSGAEMTIVVWNKVGRDGQVQSGSTTATVNPTLTFCLQPDEQQTIAIMDDTQYGFAQATDDISFAGQFETTWGECNTVKGGDTCNVSAIPNRHGNTYKMSISNTGNDCVSSEEQNCWYLDSAHPGCDDPKTNWSKLECTKVKLGLDGKDRNGSCYVNTGKGLFTTRMGGQQ